MNLKLATRFAGIGVPLVISQSLHEAELPTYNGEISAKVYRCDQKISRACL
jgi:hypothetical protein